MRCQDSHQFLLRQLS